MQEDMDPSEVLGMIIIWLTEMGYTNPPSIGPKTWYRFSTHYLRATNPENEPVLFGAEHGALIVKFLRDAHYHQISEESRRKVNTVDITDPECFNKIKEQFKL